MTIPAKYTLTEAHFIIGELEKKVAKLEADEQKTSLRIMAAKQYLRRTQSEGLAPTAVAVRAILDGEDDA